MLALSVVLAGCDGSDVPSPDSPSAGSPQASTAPREQVWPRWDGQAAPDDGRLAPSIPDVIRPPLSSPSLRELPGEAVAALAHSRTRLVQLLGTDGAWRSVPLPGQGETGIDLSPAGTRVVVYERDGFPAVTYDLTTGRATELELPDGLDAGHLAQWRFLDEDSLLFLDDAGSQVVDAATGRAEPAAFRGNVLAVDQAGEVLTGPGKGGPAVLHDHRGGTDHRLSTERIGTVLSIAADDDVVAAVARVGEEESVVLADRATLAPLARLPLGKDRADYGTFDLRVMAISTDGTVLLSKVAFLTKTQSVLAWDPTTGVVTEVSYQYRRPLNVALADDYLRERSG